MGDEDDDLESYWALRVPQEWDPEKFVRDLAVQYIHTASFYVGLFNKDQEIDCPRQPLHVGSDGKNTNLLEFKTRDYTTVTKAALFNTADRFADPLLFIEISRSMPVVPGIDIHFDVGSITFLGLPDDFSRRFPD